MNLTPEHIGMLKGATATALLFIAGIAIGLFFLHRKHEEEMDKLQKDTAITCLDFATEHYEGVIRRREKEAKQTLQKDQRSLDDQLKYQRTVIRSDEDATTGDS